MGAVKSDSNSPAAGFFRSEKLCDTVSDLGMRESKIDGSARSLRMHRESPTFAIHALLPRENTTK